LRTSTTRRPKSVRLGVNPLDARDIPSATPLDLTTDGSQAMASGAILQQTDAQPTGTGYIRSFVRVQATGEQEGFNTDARPLQFDENSSPQFTRSVTVGEMPVVVVDGVEYRELLLDINQSSAAPYLALEELRLYVGSTSTLTGYDAATGTLAGLAPVYDLDAAGDVSVQMNYRLNAGSGAGDVKFLIPMTAFEGQLTSDYLYVYSKFTGGNAGFEEWAVRTTPRSSRPPVELGSLSGYVYLDSNNSGIREAGPEEPGLVDVFITLRGTNDLGETVVLTTRTNADGFYSFAGLRPGFYTILETQPVEYLDGQESIGSLGGSVDDDRFFDIDLTGLFRDGTDYNFGEREEGENPPN
jgi:hypothetical protein